MLTKVLAPSAKDYVAGSLGYIYPALGEARPPGGAKVLILTKGGRCISGTWNDLGDYLAWSPMPRRTDYSYPSEGDAQPGSGELLLFTKGGVCVFGPWSSDGRYLGWASLPARDRSKEESIKALASAQQWRKAA